MSSGHVSEEHIIVACGERLVARAVMVRRVTKRRGGRHELYPRRIVPFWLDLHDATAATNDEVSGSRIVSFSITTMVVLMAG